MDQSNDTHPGASLPQPAMPYPTPAPGVPQAAPPMPLAPHNQQPSTDGQPPQAWLPPTVPVDPSSQTTATDTQTTSAPGQAQSTVPQEAHDVDLIEKEWLEHAKTIIDRTRQDPYAQANELQQLKTQYLQKRYNKTIESTEK